MTIYRSGTMWDAENEAPTAPSMRCASGYLDAMQAASTTDRCVSPVAVGQNPAVHSPDGQWWWDGSAWRPAVSPDGLAWFDGTTWQPRGPAGSSPRSVVIVIVTVTLALAGLAASIVFYARVSGEAHDEFALDDDVVRGAAASACLAVSQALDQAGPDRVRRIAEGNVAIGGLVDAMEALGEPRLEEDRPAIDWIRDWEALAEARAEYSTVLVAGGDEPFLSPQTDDGYPITTRMVEVAPEQCEHAVLLASQP